MTSKRPTRSDRLLRAVDKHDNIVVIMHDNPDPDAISAGWALHTLIRKRLGKRVRVVGGGDIVRAENRQLVKLLRPPIELVTEVAVDRETAAILVDCNIEATNHLMANDTVRPIAVIDHHDVSGVRRPRLPFSDIRTTVAAAASIAASYLREQQIEPGSRLGTGLYYGIRTETKGAQVRHSRLDRSILRWLADYTNPEWVAEIENAPLPQAYFTDLSRALANTTIHGGAAFCVLQQVSSPEIVGEVADLLIRYRAVHKVLCAAVVNGDLIASVRTDKHGPDASRLVRAVLSGLGGGGGHTQRAGGKVPATRLVDYNPASLEVELKRRWLATCRSRHRAGVPLVEGRNALEL